MSLPVYTVHSSGRTESSVYKAHIKKYRVTIRSSSVRKKEDWAKGVWALKLPAWLEGLIQACMRQGGVVRASWVC